MPGILPIWLPLGKRCFGPSIRRPCCRLHAPEIAKVISAAIAGADPDIRQFLKEALYLDAYNADLSRELGKFVIRHRRQTDHRLFRVGFEYGLAAQSLPVRPDGHILHAAPGLDIRGEAELRSFFLCAAFPK